MTDLMATPKYIRWSSKTEEDRHAWAKWRIATYWNRVEVHLKYGPFGDPKIHCSAQWSKND